MGEWSRENTNGIEETQIQFCKQVLGVNKQCPTVACRNEVGRLPLREITNVNKIKFWIHLENKQDDHYAKQCLQISKDMPEKNQMSLMKRVNTLCNNSNLNKTRHAGRHIVIYVKACYSHDNSLGQAVPGTANLANEVIGRCQG